MEQFFLAHWTSVWAEQAQLGDRVRGVIFLLLVISLLAFVLGALAERAQSWKIKAPPPDGAPKTTWQAVWSPTAHVLRGLMMPAFPLAEYFPISAGASVIFSLLLALLGLDRELRWAAAGAAIPAILVLLQYVYLWVHKPTEHDASASPDSIKDRHVQAARAKRAVNSAYGARTLFIRYGFPAILLLIEGLVLVFTLVRPQGFLALQRWELAYGAQFGAMGAYAWVILELGRRSFRRDVTSGIAMWSIVTLAVGPMLAAVIALLWKPTPNADNAWQMAVVFFYAGYAPRTVLSAVTSAATQLLRIGPAPIVETRTTPLTKIRGINAQIEERLGEEGIDNVETLATVEPFRLHRDTSFDLGTIVWWIDEALLLMYVPQRWQLLEEQGITGAIDLADLPTNAPPLGPPTSNVPPAAASPSGTPPKDAIESLANRVNMTRPEFEALVNRIRADRHVNYIWWIYNVYGTNGANESEP